jgi:hypothetical protein
MDSARLRQAAFFAVAGAIPLSVQIQVFPGNLKPLSRTGSPAAEGPPQKNCLCDIGNFIFATTENAPERAGT